MPGFADAFLLDGQVPREGQVLRQPALADTLERLGAAGLDDFYRGELATALAGDLARAGSPVTRDDLAAYQARVVEPCPPGCAPPPSITSRRPPRAWPR